MAERRIGHLTVREIEAKSVLNAVRGMPFKWSINPYAGCLHGCVFCYARKTHRYREQDGVRAWDNLLTAKLNAAAVLRDELRRLPLEDDVALGTATDPYQAIEARYRITQGIVVELLRARVSTGLVTRSPLVLRDLDLWAGLARRAPVTISVSLPTVDAGLARELEPTVASPAARLDTVRRLAQAGIRTGVAVAPIVPGLTDGTEQLERVRRAAVRAGAAFCWFTPLRLGEVARDAFFAYLHAKRPALVARYEQLYRTSNVAAAYRRDLDARVAAVERRYALAPVPHVEPETAAAQLSLL